jgi:membrane protein YdbS with pleckstrin-like domain
VAFPRRLLSEGEELVVDLRPHWIALVAPLGLTALIVAAVVLAFVYLPASWPNWVTWVVVVAGIVLFAMGPLPRIVKWATSHFVVTSDRLIHRSGWVAKHSMEIPLEKISDVRFHQGVFERLIGAGDLTIESPGEYGQESFSDIRRPEQVQKLIYEMGEANQRRMVSPSPVPGPVSGSLADELAKLEQLRAGGVLSESEFQAEKARLLHRE